MADAARVVPSEASRKIGTTSVHVSMRVKLFAVLVSAVALPVVGVLFFSNESNAPFFDWLHTYKIAIFGIELPFEALVLFGVACIAVFCADTLISRIFYNRIDALLRWSREFRQSEFTHVPLLPRLAHDEIGDLGTELGISAAQFLRMSEQAHTSSDEKAVFLTMAAHQLRTPLTAVSWSIESLLDPRMSEADKQKLLPQLNAQLRRMLLVVGQILASARIEEGKFGFVFSPSDIVSVIDTLIKDFRPLADEKKIALVFEHPESVPQVYVDSERISLAIFDLIANAIDYSHNGGTVTIGLRPDGERVEVSVADAGIGIPEKDIPHLFTKFYRGENARIVRPDGSGLGLYLVKNIITNHGSEIVVRSDATKGGSRFSFYLPTQKP